MNFIPLYSSSQAFANIPSPLSSAVKLWLDDPSNFPLIEAEFNSTSKYARLKSVFTTMAGWLLFIRFKASTGDAMGMNMVSKVCVLVW